MRVPSPKIYEQVFATTEINNLSYWLEIVFSAGIATFGLVENSPAVIIGAMLISPLMGPIMATGLALAVGDLYQGIKAVFNLLASVAVSIAFSGFLVWLLPFHSATSEIISRTTPNLLDWELPFCPDWLVRLWFVAVEATELLLSPESPSR